MKTKRESIQNIIDDWRNSQFKLDKRTKSYKQASRYFSDAELKKAIAVNRRRRARMIQMAKRERSIVTHKDRVAFIQFIKRHELKFNPNAYSSRFNSTGVDWAKYHRPTSNGKGWVCIAPDEPGNNAYIEDPIMVEFLSKRYG